MRTLSIVIAGVALIPALAQAQKKTPEPDVKASVEAPKIAAPTVEKPTVKAPKILAPEIMHRPISSAPADDAIAVTIFVENGARLTQLALVVQNEAGTVETVVFERMGPTEFLAKIPSTLTAGQWVAYSIESVDRGGEARAHFATREAPHRIDLYGYGSSAKQRRQLDRYDGNRNQISITGEWVGFGKYEQPQSFFDDTPQQTVDALSDSWGHLRAEYIYRPLTTIHDFRFRAGFMRATVPKNTDGVKVRRGAAPGINYGAAEVNLELHRWFSLGGRFILGANETGFVLGAGGVARVGDMTSTHFAADVEIIDAVGSRTDLRLHWDTVPRFPMALGVTFTDWPDAQDSTRGSGNLLAYDVGFEFTPGTVLSLRMGTAVRPASLTTGYMGGATFKTSF